MPRNILGPGGAWNPFAKAYESVADPGGLIGPGGTVQNPLTSDNLGALVGKLRECIGAPYLAYSAGGDGRNNTTVEEVMQNGESCSGLFIFAFLQLGIEPGFYGTQDLPDKLSNREDFDPNKSYPAGTFLVTPTPGEGHMAMVTGSGNQLIQSFRSAGVNESYTAAESIEMGADMQFLYAGTLDSVGSATLSSLGGELTGWAEWIAEGIVSGGLRLLKALYGYLILRPIDLFSGFWWELTRRMLAYLKANQVAPEGWELPGADATTEELEGENKEEGAAFSEEDKKRIYFLAWLFVTYYLAFGRDQEGNYHFDNVAQGAANLFNRDAYGKRNYNNVARVRARPVAVTTARRKARATSRRNIGGTDDGRPTVQRRRPKRGAGGRDPQTGRFRKAEAAGTETEQSSEAVRIARVTKIQRVEKTERGDDQDS